MPTKATTTKWVAVLRNDDIYITEVSVKITPKQMRIVKHPYGDGKNTAVGYNGTKESKSWLLGFHTVFDKKDPRFHDTYEDARNHIRKLLEAKRDAADREVEKAAALFDLFNEVKYVKEDQPLTFVSESADG
jgi:hypothetical protein